MGTFEHLLRKEDGWRVVPEGAGPQPPLQIECGSAGLADEPWVTFVNRDYFGLALSGGGVRSATFNLGLLPALSQLGLLTHAHYLSTVSGGGYVGGFLTALAHHASPAEVERALGSHGNRTGGSASTRSSPCSAS